MASPDLKFSEWENYYLNILNNLKPGISELIVHLGYDDKEMQEITIEHPNFGSKWRELDMEIVSSEKFRKALVDNNIKAGYLERNSKCFVLRITLIYI